MNVAYIGPLQDYSGYGEANRHIVAALDAAGIMVNAQLVTYSRETADFGSIGDTVDRLLNYFGEYKIKILHTTPDQYRKYMEPNTYHIGHFFWETSKVPADFKAGLELMDEIWTGSEANREAILSSGVDKPVYIFPQPIEVDRDPVEPYDLPGIPVNQFLFYSIFEWTDRKNPEALLDAYWREFQDNENVGLLIKTYFTNFTYGNKRMIKGAIEKLKSRAGIINFPPVYLYLDLMDRQQIVRLHETGDCFVSATHGEGWGVPQVEAALQQNPVITTGYGGCAEYFENYKTAYITPYKMVPVRGMLHSSEWYTREQYWAEVDPYALRQNMRAAYEDREQAEAIGTAGRQLVVNEFNFKNVGQLMAKRLQEIEASL